MAPFPAPETGILLTHFVVSEDVARSRDFYANVLGQASRDADPDACRADPDATSSFLNIRVANIQEIYDDWSAKGAQFLTPPIALGVELRSYLHDPDGHLIEVGQANRGFLKEPGLLT
jgi:catechol 2,3-dioxygenase-like lactoylglutathione lyase family enzyme